MLGFTNVQTPVAATLSAFLATGGFGADTARKTVTFNNTVGIVPLFTVTGDVIVRVIAVVQVNCASALGCNAEVGVASDTDIILPTTDITLMLASAVWQDNAPNSDIEALATASKNYVIGAGADIRMTLSAQADSGVIAFYCQWTPLSAGATVVAA
jgi:hypothetical protein